MSAADKFVCFMAWMIYSACLIALFDVKWVVLWMATFATLFFIVEAAVCALKRQP